MNGRDRLFKIAELLGDTQALHEIIVAMSEHEASEMADWIARMHDIEEEE
jgi:hypothetical protein